MDQYIREIKSAVDGEAWMLALTATLALPDICAALQSSDGKTTGKKYKAWVECWLGDKYPTLDADEIYKIRCSLLHQGRTSGVSYSRVIFVAPFNGNVFHNNVLNDALNLDLPTFCKDVLEAVETWRTKTSDNPTVLKNMDSMIQWYPNGLPPYVQGTPVLT